MIPFHLAMLVLPAAIVALAAVLARTTRLRPAPAPDPDLGSVPDSGLGPGPDPTSER